MRAIHPFAIGHVIGGLLVGVLAGISLPGIDMVLLGAAAAVASAVCWWRPGFEAPGWQLWLAGVLASPLMLAALGYMAAELDCLIGSRLGWDCLGAALAIIVAGLGLLPPVGGLLWRWWSRRSSAP